MTHDEAVRQVIQYIIDGRQYVDVKADAAKTHGTKSLQIIEDAAKEIMDIGNEDPSFTRGWALAATRELVRKMIEEGDYQNALKGIKQASDLAGD